MHELPDVVINVAVAGSFSLHEDRAGKQIERVLFEILSRGADYQDAKFGFSENPVKVNLFTGPQVADQNWLAFVDRKEVFLHAILSSRGDDEASRAYVDQASAVVNMRNSVAASVGSKAFIVEWLADQADVAIVLWDGSEEGTCADGWQLLRACKNRGIPSIWIDVNDPDHVCWALASYFEPFRLNKLKEYLAALLGAEAHKAPERPGKRILFANLWQTLYDRFMKKYKAQVKPIPCEKDRLVQPDYPFAPGSSAVQTHRKLLACYRWYDANAIDISGKFNAALYFRAMIPFVVTLFLALGFYVETIFGFALKPLGIDVGFLSYLAGFGFLMHAALNLYVYTLSKNQQIHSYKKYFLDNRFIAEYVRVGLHFAPFGIPFAFSEQVFPDAMDRKGDLYLKIRKLVRSIDCADVQYDQSISRELLDNLELMLDEQINYHNLTQKRYELIAERLSQFEKIFFFIGFLFVLLRGLLQVTVVPLTDANAAEWKSFAKSTANMLALVLPAWASYFSSKLSLCNFKGLKEDNEAMAAKLRSFKVAVDDLRVQGKPSYESMYALSRSVSNLITGDVRNWYVQMSSRNFTKL